MNVLFPQALNFDDRSSVLDTLEAFSRYGIKPPSLNADRLEELLKKTEMNEDLQASVVRGWREGFNLGRMLPDKAISQGDQKQMRSKKKSSEPD